MDKKILCAIGIVIVIIIAYFIYSGNYMKPYLTNDGNGHVEFNKIGDDTGYGIDIDQGEFPIDVELSDGELNIKISKGLNVIFEQTNITESQQIVPYIPESGFYIITLSGKHATGNLNHPVGETVNTPEIPGVDLDTNIVDENIVKTVLEAHFKETYEDEVEEVKIISSKIYTQEEIEESEELKELNLKSKDIAFEVEYELKIKEGTQDLMKYTVSSGEIDGQWIKNKANCGVARYDEENDKYILSDFGTAF